MEKSVINSLLTAVMLNHRHVNYMFRIETGVNRTQLEILAFANSVVSFNPYQVQKHFKQMNLQQVRTNIKKLVETQTIERLNTGVKNNPAVYVINNKGREILDSYNQLWYNLVMP